jgi:hypothetical protein
MSKLRKIVEEMLSRVETCGSSNTDVLAPHKLAPHRLAPRGPSEWRSS